MVAFGAAAAAGAVLCPLNAVTGLDCPFCGGTRAVFAAARGDLTAAFSHNALVMTVALLAPIIAPVAFVVARHPELRPKVAAVPWAAVAVTVLVCFAVLRNLPVSWLEPLRAA